MQDKPPRQINERDISLTFAKGMSVLKAFDTSAQQLTLPQIVRVTGLDRATTRRLVLTLVHLGYVKQDDRLYSLTPRIMVLAGGFLQARRFGKTIEPVMRSFATQIDMSISMAMIDEYQGVYVAHVGATADNVSIGFTVGSKVPLLGSAIGRALVAACPAETQADILAHAPLEAFTPHTLMDREAIAQNVKAAGAQGYAFVIGEFEAGVAGIAVSAPAQDGTAMALGVSANATRFEDAAYRDHVITCLRNCAQAVSALL